MTTPARTLRRSLRRLAAPVGLAAALAAASPAGAQYNGPVTGIARGCFYTTVPCTPAQLSMVVAHYGLHYRGVGTLLTSPATFGTAVNGVLDPITLGSFQLFDDGNNRTANFTGVFFNLLVDFQQPATAGHVLTAAVTGTFVTRSNGTASIVFGAPRVIEYTSAGGPGAFLLTVNPVTVNIGPGGNPLVPLTGRLSQVTTTPEPGTLALLATGLLGAGAFGALRRRRGGRLPA